jgi:hypothetical protein
MVELGRINQAKVWSYHEMTLRNILEQLRLCGLTTGQYVWTTLKASSSTINIKIARSNWSLLWCNSPSLMDHHEFFELLVGVRLLFREFPRFCNVTEPAIYTTEQALGRQFCHPWGHQACLIIITYGGWIGQPPRAHSLLCLMMIMMMTHKNGDADSIWKNLKTYDDDDSRGVHHLKTQSRSECNLHNDISLRDWTICKLKKHLQIFVCVLLSPKASHCSHNIARCISQGKHEMLNTQLGKYFHWDE